MAFPVDLLENYSHEDLESSAEDYLSDLRCGDPENPEFLSLVNNVKIPICLSTVGFVPLYGGEERHKVLALFAPEDSLAAVALFLADQWWTIDDIVRTSVLSREGLQQVKTIGERVVLYVLNRIIYRKQEIEKNEFPFLCHGSHDYAKILWKKGEAIGFYSVKPTGSVCTSFLTQSYQLPVLDTVFVRKKHKGKDFGLFIMEDFVDSFTEDALGLRFPMTSFMHAACQKYFEKYPGDHDLLWEVEGVGRWHQRTLVTSILERESLQYIGVLQKESGSSQAEESFLQSPVDHSTPSVQASDANDTQLSMDSRKSKDGIDVCEGTSEEVNVTPLFTRSRSNHLKRPKIGKRIQVSDDADGEDGNISEASENRLEPAARVSESSEELIEETEENIAEHELGELTENRKQPVQEVQQLSEKQDDKEESDVEPLNGELMEHAIKVSLVTEGETASEAMDGEAKLQSDSSEETTLTLLVPLILDSSEKSPEGSDDNMSDKIESMADSEVPLEEEQAVAHRKRGVVHNADLIASSQKDEPSNNGLLNSVATEAPEDTISENVSPNTTSSLEEQSEGGSDSPEAPVALGQGSLVMVELEDIAYQQHTEGQKNQMDEQSEESAEPASERAADSSSEEVEVEVPIIDRRTLRRKAKGYKGPPKKKGKLI
ncbi:soluble lamin-associated protein of 75 kDa [Heteronotia binoei]|uniref:soluble lamin-associated protein of 75 kDa n=1 Tax=Heteronotia binoei TaxID=13085 RepID=UPI002931CD60|nr:soluble lamin-associated protein of 75 kDa [Heteronotia binoei]XP_060091805.1 soluble lamin-associated protein of 75 kDa [Heteronotia binoei]XP_060091806.1 soluble lamin-associated protein of 75 kDa [Heteronotia binoei]XP_060091807.1 soluble lamin-associated protein of 75 kDa [Heteronotia binoei]